MWRTTLVPKVSLMAGIDPSSGTSLMVAVFRKTTRLEKSASPGLVQLMVNSESPCVAPAPVTSLGERLSMVIVALPVSVPNWALVQVKDVMVPVTVYSEPAGAGMLAWLLGVIRTLKDVKVVVTGILILLIETVSLAGSEADP